MYSNIEKSAFHSGVYIGYAMGPWRIVRSNGKRGPWLATHSMDCRVEPISAPTLREVSALLAERQAAHAAACLPIVTKC
jgi:hypothetical protein